MSNSVPVEDGVFDRVLAVNLLHEVKGERALAEMRICLHALPAPIELPFHYALLARSGDG